MGIVAKIVPDHIRIQFGTGQPHHTEAVPPIKLGELAGAHYVQVEYLIDEETGAVVGQTNNPLNGMAQALPFDRVQELLGSRFVDLETQIRALTEALATERAQYKAEMEKARTVVSALTSERNALAADRDTLIKRAKTAVESLGFQLQPAGT